MSTEPIDTDFDAWATTDIPGHVQALLARVPSPSRPSRPPWRQPAQVIAALGDTNRKDLCWVCYSGPVRTGPTLPQLRACNHCLIYDRRQAQKLGFAMLMPLMNWHTQPILPGRNPPTQPMFRSWLADLWCEVEKLAQWRMSGVRASFALLGLSRDTPVHTWDWMHTMRWSPARSKACWDAYMAGFHPRLFDTIQRVDRHLLERG